MKNLVLFVRAVVSSLLDLERRTAVRCRTDVVLK
jgi:hypothetical protein